MSGVLSPPQRPLCVAIFNPAGASTRRRESGVRFNEERNKQHDNRPIYTRLTNICTTSSPVDPQMRGNLNAWVLLAQGAFVRDGPS